MGVLHYQLHCNGNVGMCNLLMSIENALVISYLTDRRIIFYGTGKVMGSNWKTIFDLYDIHCGYEIADSNIVDERIPSLHCDFYNTVFYFDQYPDYEFLDGRNNVVDINDYWQYKHLRTLDNRTLGFYSYLFYLPKGIRQEVQQYIKQTLQPKPLYRQHAKEVIANLHQYSPIYNSISVRRGDYVHDQYVRNGQVTAADLLPVLRANFNSKDRLLIHTDETDSVFFDAIRDEFVNVWLLDNDLIKAFPDKAECGLVSMLIAGESDGFIGTMHSTFSAYISRLRLWNKKKEEFKYLYPQKDGISMTDNGAMSVVRNGKYTWNKISIPPDMQSIKFWFREWPECFI